MDELKPKPGSGQERPAKGPQGTRAPVKGESSASGVPLPDAGATFLDPSAKKPPVDPGATVLNPNLTLDGDSRTPFATGARLYGSAYRDVILQPGDLFGGRYEIMLLLGEGGMGSVYKAKDREVDRIVALKLIRPDLADNPSILARFKQELLTAHRVTHKNVIRIYDLSEAEGVKYITMEFIEGTDLRHLLINRGKFPPEQAVDIMRQVCLALDAAHSAGIIHRDLKPQNIMQDKNGRILVMDFGLARSLESEGMTQTGALLGTIEYMSPEQSMGKTLDQRSDLFAVGLIFYELLSGKTPYKAETGMASLLRRNQERAVPVRELDHTIPVGLSDIVSKCLERDLNLRYQSAAEILADLDAWQGKRPVTASVIAAAPSVVIAGHRGVSWKWIAVGCLAVALGVSGWVYRGGGKPPGGTKTAAGPETSLAILPFHNDTNDPSIDWLGQSLADMLSTDVGQSAHMRTVSPDRLHQIFADLRIQPNANLDPDTLRKIAEFSNADTVVWGHYAKYGSQIRIDATLQDLKRDRRAPLKIEAANEQAIPGTIDKLAELIRSNLAVSPDVLKELKASSFQPSSKSVPALREYNHGVQLLRDGKNLEAVKSLQAAIKEDPGFALAYSRLAETDDALGYGAEAESNSRKALQLSQQLPVSEKYLIQAIHARMMKDNKKAIEAYENLAKVMPDNTDVEFALGNLYNGAGEYDKARTQLSKILAADPKNIKALWQMGVVEINKDNPQAALDPLNKGLTLSIQLDNQEQRALILQAIGISYRLMNKPEEAKQSIQQSMDINRKLNLSRNLANNLSEMALIEMTLGNSAAALTDYGQALPLLKGIGAKKDYGDVLINRGGLYVARGDSEKALQDYKEGLQIQRDADDENYQALCLGNIGSVYLGKGDTDNALIYFQQALQLRQKLNDPEYLAETLNGLGAVYTATGDYDKALTSLMQALDVSRKANNAKGAAAVSDQMGMIMLYQGRPGAAVSAMQDAVNGYRGVNNKSSEMIESLNDLAGALAQAGRGDESGKLLDEAQELSSGLNKQSFQSELFISRGDVAFYRGDLKAAKAAYEQAMRAAAASKDREKAVIAKMDLARVAIAEGRPLAAINDLRAAIQQADTLHMKYFALRGSVDLGEALINTKDYARARQELESAVGRSEKLGLRLETARIHYLLGNLLKLIGNGSEAPFQYQQALRILDEIKKEPGAEKLLERPDLKSMHEQSSSTAQAAKS